MFRPGFVPRPSKAEVRESLAGKPRPHFVNYAQTTGKEFGTHVRFPATDPPLDRPDLPSKLSSPSRTFESTQIRYKPRPDFFPEPADDLCHPAHRNWLKQHYA